MTGSNQKKKKTLKTETGQYSWHEEMKNLVSESSLRVMTNNKRDTTWTKAYKIINQIK